MSLDILNQLEQQIQQTIDTINMMTIEINELRAKNTQLEQQITYSSDTFIALQEENQRLKQEQQVWQERLQGLLSRMKDIG